MKIYQRSFLKNILLILSLIAITLAINAQVISFNMMYFEQPIMYVANQHALNFKDLLHQYLHPYFLQYAVPFFRPSGHFLMYYLLAPLFGWHNTQAFIIVNLLFLALSGWLIIKIYQLLFPGFVVGGYIAFAIYLMHPATMLSRLSIMHFEYVYVFFALAGLYCFILFSQKNVNAVRYQYFSYLIYSLMFFAIATTFKEPALMLGPVYFAYFVIEHNYSISKDDIKILLLLIISTLILFFYITSPWRSFFSNAFLHNPLRQQLDVGGIFLSTKEMFRILFCLPTFRDGLFHTVSNPALAKWIMILGSGLAAILFVPKKSVIFLMVAFIVFLILPVVWGMSLPWHLNPALLFYAMLIGYAFEKLLLILNMKKSLGIALASCIALIAIPVNKENITRLVTENGMELKLNSNAIFHPPIVKKDINPHTIILVEAKQITNPYLIGDSYYPYILHYDANFNAMRIMEEAVFVKYDPIYSGNLFKYAYLMPSLREEDYPFSIDKMAELPDVVIYNWLQNKNNILCFGFDNKSHWLDKTALFQKNLLIEAKGRKLIVNSYQKISQKKWLSKSIARLIPFVADPLLCQMECDKRKKCNGFVMLSPNYHINQKAQCLLYSNVSQLMRPCKVCKIYIKRV